MASGALPPNCTSEHIRPVTTLPQHAHRGRLWGSQARRWDTGSAGLTAALGSDFSQNTESGRFYFFPLRTGKNNANNTNSFTVQQTDLINSVRHYSLHCSCFAFAFSGLDSYPRVRNLTSTCFHVNDLSQAAETYHIMLTASPTNSLKYCLS